MADTLTETGTQYSSGVSSFMLIIYTVRLDCKQIIIIMKGDDDVSCDAIILVT